LIWNKKHKKAGKVLTKETIKTFLYAHKKFWHVMEFFLPVLMTFMLGWIILLISVACGLRFSSVNNFYTTLIIGGLILFFLFYEIVKSIIKNLME
jgi:hypothetical protein